MTDIRECEFCKYLETPDDLCSACNGWKVLRSKDCFCCAYEPSECCCDADWSDYNYYEEEENEN